MPTDHVDWDAVGTLPNAPQIEKVEPKKERKPRTTEDNQTRHATLIEMETNIAKFSTDLAVLSQAFEEYKENHKSLDTGMVKVLCDIIMTKKKSRVLPSIAYTYAEQLRGQL